MARTDRYKQFAAECVRVAQQASNPNDKAMLLEMADTWLKLAEKVAKPDGEASQGPHAGSRGDC